MQGTYAKNALSTRLCDFGFKAEQLPLYPLLDQVVSHAGHCGNYRHHLVSSLLGREDATSHIQDALGSSDGRAAIFLDD